MIDMSFNFNSSGVEMSVFCPNCQKITYDEYTCDHCQYEIKKNSAARSQKEKYVYGQLVKNKKAYMTPCEICGEDIAVKATSCPYCGDIKSKNLTWKIVKIVFIIIAILFVIDLIVGGIAILYINNKFNDSNIEETTKQIHNELIKDVKVPQFSLIQNNKNSNRLKVEMKTIEEIKDSNIKK